MNFSIFLGFFFQIFDEYLNNFYKFFCDFFQIFNEFFCDFLRFETYINKKQRTRRPLIFDGNHPIHG